MSGNEDEVAFPDLRGRVQDDDNDDSNSSTGGGTSRFRDELGGGVVDDPDPTPESDFPPDPPEDDDNDPPGRAPPTGGSSGGLGGDPVGDPERDVDPQPAQPDPATGGSSGGLGGNPVGDPDRSVDPAPTEPDPNAGGSSGGLGGDPVGDSDRDPPTETPTGDDRPDQPTAPATGGSSGGLGGDPTDPAAPAEQREFTAERDRSDTPDRDRILAATRARQRASDQLGVDPANVAVDLDRTGDGFQARATLDDQARVEQAAASSVAFSEGDLTVDDGELTLSDQGVTSAQQTRRDAVNNLLESSVTGAESPDQSTDAAAVLGGALGGAGDVAAAVPDALSDGNGQDTTDVADPPVDADTLLAGSGTERVETGRSVETIGGQETVTPSTRREPGSFVAASQDFVSEFDEDPIGAVETASLRAGDFVRDRVVAPTADVAGDVGDLAAPALQFQAGTDPTVMTTAPEAAQETREAGLEGLGGDEFTTDAQDILRAPEDEQGGESVVEQRVDRGAQGIGETAAFIAEGPATAINLGETGAGAAEFTAEQVEEEGLLGGLQESGEAAAATGQQFAERTLRQAANNPAFTAGTLLGTSAAIGGATRLSPRTGRATAAAIQPGEELLSAGLSRASPGLASRFPNDRVDNEEIALRGAARGAEGVVEGTAALRDRVLSEFGDLEAPDSPLPNVRVSAEANPDAGLLDVRTSGDLSERLGRVPDEVRQTGLRTQRTLRETPATLRQEGELAAGEAQEAVGDAFDEAREQIEETRGQVEQGARRTVRDASDLPSRTGQEVGLGVRAAQDRVAGVFDESALAVERGRRRAGETVTRLGQELRLGVGEAQSRFSDAFEGAAVGLANVDDSLRNARQALTQAARTAPGRARDAVLGGLGTAAGRAQQGALRAGRAASEAPSRLRQEAILGVGEAQDAVSGVFDDTADAAITADDILGETRQRAELGLLRTRRRTGETATGAVQEAILGVGEAQDTVSNIFDRTAGAATETSQALRRGRQRAELGLLRTRRRAGDAADTARLTASQLGDVTFEVDVGLPERRQTGVLEEFERPEFEREGETEAPEASIFNDDEAAGSVFDDTDGETVVFEPDGDGGIAASAVETEADAGGQRVIREQRLGEADEPLDTTRTGTGTDRGDIFGGRSEVLDTPGAGEFGTFDDRLSFGGGDVLDGQDGPAPDVANDPLEVPQDTTPELGDGEVFEFDVDQPTDQRQPPENIFEPGFETETETETRTESALELALESETETETETEFRTETETERDGRPFVDDEDDAVGGGGGFAVSSDTFSSGILSAEDILDS